MFAGDRLVNALASAGVSHVVWLPDSEIGRWNEPLSRSARPTLIRVCREGEAFGIAAGLYLGGEHPIVVVQCTGLFEAGDALRNTIHDMQLPLFIVVGYRGYYTHEPRDTAAKFIEPILHAWEIKTRIFEREDQLDEFIDYYRQSRQAKTPAVALLAERRL